MYNSKLIVYLYPNKRTTMEEAIKQINALISSETNTDARMAFRTALLIFTEAKLKYNEEMLALEKSNYKLKSALSDFTKSYKAAHDSGDWGNWDLSEDKEYVSAINAIND